MVSYGYGLFSCYRLIPLAHRYTCPVRTHLTAINYPSKLFLASEQSARCLEWSWRWKPAWWTLGPIWSSSRSFKVQLDFNWTTSWLFHEPGERTEPIIWKSMKLSMSSCFDKTSLDSCHGRVCVWAYVGVESVPVTCRVETCLPLRAFCGTEEIREIFIGLQISRNNIFI